MKRMALAGLAVGAGLLLTACEFDVNLGASEQEAKTYDLSADVTHLVVEAKVGDVVVNESDRKGVRVTETLQWRSSKPVTERPVDDKKLTLRYTCERAIVSDCGVHYKVEVPRGLNIRVDNGVGTVTLRNLSGEFTVVSGTGDIEGAGITSKRADAESGTGRVDLAFAGAPDEVTIKTGVGDASLRVPDSGYNVEGDSGLGEVTVQIKDDPASPRRLEVTAGTGEVEVLKS
ncbi:hypothetical protein Ssi02_01680 [Sinosporangium siamense]|uniref:Adhesin n=2 Tax=Sinosporangium siamense TaxID=1367973 RepID=A0A919RAH2_9ACTN|nr:hypothetical protein Ssi02_01680 [Sinosporangium siamense]